jgi:enoyl-CoA hydratase
VSQLATYQRDGQSATITIDDGKVNVFSIPMLKALHVTLDQAEQDGVIVVLTGRQGYFSAGFDLKAFASGIEETVEILNLGASLAERVLAFPAPVIVACSGHAYPAGAFLMLAADLRIGVDGPFAIGLNEVRIGLTLPWFAIELARHRLAPAYFDRALITSAMCGPQEAVTAGFLDRVVAPADLSAAARQGVDELAQLDRAAHAATKLRVRGRALEALRHAIESELKPGVLGVA